MKEESRIIRKIGDDLTIRRGMPQDADALADFNAGIHREEGLDEPNQRVGIWTRDLLTKPHPTFHAGDFTIVEDSRTGKIVSSLNIISQTWSYAGIPFGVGRIELVGTSPDYRNRGLVRAQFDIVHQWSAERGERLQAITGIPFYYRQFGYEMALNLGGGRAGYQPQIPKLKNGEDELFHVRPAKQIDLPFIASLYQQGCLRSLVSCHRDETLWNYELSGKSPQNINRMELCVIETKDSKSVGFLAHPPFTWGPTMVAVAYEVKMDVSWEEVTPSVIRYLFSKGEAYSVEQKDTKDFSAFGFWMGSEHPVYQVLRDGLPRVRKPYAWYLRLPDIPSFLQHIAPVLDQRLSASPFAGLSGNIKITFYRQGIRMDFSAGRLTRIESWKPKPTWHSGDAAFPGLTFLQLLFGYHSLEELDYAHADIWWKDDRAFGLLNALFPKQPSDVWPVA